MNEKNVSTRRSDTREAARAKARARVQEEQRRAARRRKALVTGAVVAVVVLVIGIGVAVQAARSGVDAAAARPSGVTAVGGVTRGDAAAPVAIRIYLDFQCPACRTFEEANSAYLESLVDEGRATLEYVPVSILDRYSTTRYATRSANAAYCAIDADPVSFPAVNTALFAAQPPENTPGLTDDQLGETLTAAGAPDDVLPCIADGRFEEYVATVTDKASADGLQGTPTVMVDGQQLTELSSDALRAAVEAAGA